MSDREMLLCKLSGAQFAALEMHLYLDTHPHDQRALASRNAYREEAEALRKEFENRFGPLTAADAYGDCRWDWVNAPWPWENPKEVR